MLCNGLIDVTTVDASHSQGRLYGCSQISEFGQPSGHYRRAYQSRTARARWRLFQQALSGLQGAKALANKNTLSVMPMKASWCFHGSHIFEGDPHSVIEGMLLGGYAIGAEQGYVYIRAEYPVALERLQAAFEARARGLCAKTSLAAVLTLTLKFVLVPALLFVVKKQPLWRRWKENVGNQDKSLPFPFQRGLFGKPTIISNVETLANVPAILANGADWFRQYGTSDSPGTKVLPLPVIVNTGLVEIPMGMALGHVIC